jgi:valyl-tRNA synthetase
MMFGLYCMKRVPFKDVYVHALVRDEKGQKMSKSKGNIIDPLQLIDEFGADALRFTLSSLAIPGRDMKLSRQKVEHNRNFITKIWNCAKFLEMNEAYLGVFDDAVHPLNRWILTELTRLSDEVQEHLDHYRFDLASIALYRFLWNDFCDMYIECSKILFKGEHQEETRQVSAYVFSKFLILAHPFIPFVTLRLLEEYNVPLKFPKLNKKYENTDVTTMIATIEKIRSVKGLFGLATHKLLFTSSHALNAFIASLGRVEINTNKGDLCIPIENGFLDLTGYIQRDDAIELLNRKILLIESDIEKLEKKIMNESYKIAKPDLYDEDVIKLEEKRKECLAMIQTKEVIAI